MWVVAGCCAHVTCLRRDNDDAAAYALGFLDLARVVQSGGHVQRAKATDLDLLNRFIHVQVVECLLLVPEIASRVDDLRTCPGCSSYM